MKKKFNLGLKIGKNKIKLISGFTLIELLVVIAIIGILSSIVLVSLNSSRAKAKDSAVMTQLANMKLQAEIYFDLNNNSYSGVCSETSVNKGFGGTDPGLLLDTKNATGITSIGPVVDAATAGAWNQVTCHDSTDKWAVEAPTSKSTSSSPKMFCVDNTKLVGEYTITLTSNDYICN